ncbi:hypothetical protein [Sulfurospirillum sp. MES]|uniref:hypothetical protein n=1 Tax=Sulfurospirillum sp. MES TaxID=1565314 RepID=UPI000541FCC3|nr:hypothetical protein [Sulfurospirillum sp. MES]KHG34446.1 MAG: hypothetical protein OA34_04960 [Sulfurospirillum sp. MES]
MRFLLVLILPYFLLAGSCLLIPKGEYPKEGISSMLFTKPKDNSTLGKAKDYLFPPQNDAGKVEIYVELNKSKCTNPEHPLFIQIFNNSNLPIDRMRIEIGSFLEKKNGNMFFIEKIQLNLKDDKQQDFYIQPQSSHTLCVRAPHEDWTYKRDSGIEGIIFDPKKDQLIHSYNIDELKYYLLKEGCFVGFYEK